MHENWIKYSEDIHNTIFKALSETREGVPAMSPEELTDVGWVLKKMYDQLDDVRKEVEKLKMFAEKIAALKGTSEGKDKIKGSLATGTISVNQSASLPHPKRNPDEWKALCEYLAIPDIVVQNDLVHQIHWPAFKEFLTKQQQMGKPLPPGIDPEKVRTTYYLKYRGRKKS